MKTKSDHPTGITVGTTGSTGWGHLLTKSMLRCAHCGQEVDDIWNDLRLHIKSEHPDVWDERPSNQPSEYVDLRPVLLEGD